MLNAGVHDSFWTHAGTVNEMHYILRDKFVVLHSQKLLNDLLHELKRDHPDIIFPPIPKRGKFNLGKIRASKYFFS